MSRRYKISTAPLVCLVLISLPTPLGGLRSVETPISTSSAQPAWVSAHSPVHWQRFWGGSDDDLAFGVATDSFGNSYVTGYTQSYGPGSPSNRSLSLIKYDSTGGLVWQRTWSRNGLGNGSDTGVGVAMDPSNNNIYVTGATMTRCSACFDLLILKFDSSGSLIWQKTLSYASGRLTVDASGNIYVTGVDVEGGAILLKYDPSGNLLWQKEWTCGGGDNAGQGVVVDSSGNVYVTARGILCIEANPYNSLVLLKFDSTGSLLWEKSYGGSRGPAHGYGVATDSSGDIIVAGEEDGFGTGTSLGGGALLLLKFDPSGSLQWEKDYGVQDTAYGVAVDASDNIYVTGYFYPGRQDFTPGYGGGDVLLLKFSSSGSLLLQRNWGSQGNGDARGIAIDSSGDALIVGGVSMGPPYTLGSPSGEWATLSTPPINPDTLNLTIHVPSFFIQGTPSGTVQTPPGPGNQLYGGVYPTPQHQFLINYDTNSPYSFTVDFYTAPGPYLGGGSITFNGTDYASGQFGNSALGTISISAYPPYGYTFSSWITRGGVTVSGINTNPTTATVTGPGLLEATFAHLPFVCTEPPVICTMIYLAAGSVVALSTIVIVAVAKRKRKNRTLVTGETPSVVPGNNDSSIRP